MEKQRQIKILSIIALVLAISAMTLGFAAFSTTLNISSSASVTPNSNSFAVKFSSEKDRLVEGKIVASNEYGSVSAHDGTIVNGVSPMLSNLFVTFSSPGQYVEYTVYARNEGEYTAYLNNINYIGNKTCTASTGTTEALVQSACEDINVKVTIGSKTYTETTPITGHQLAKGAGEAVKVRLEYASNGTSVDGSFDITFPSITLVYSTVDDSNVQSKVCTCVDSEDDTGSQIGKIDLSDVVTCGTESFYVMSNESEIVTMLSKYNLHVGNSVTEDNYVTPLTNPTGIQNSLAIGYAEVYPSIGTTAFSNTNSSYSGSIVEEYVNNYKKYLTNIGVNVLSARLITQEDLESVGCNSQSCWKAPDWTISTSYWTGMTSGDSILSISTFDDLAYTYYNEDHAFGVRPVIEIPESEF